MFDFMLVFVVTAVVCNTIDGPIEHLKNVWKKQKEREGEGESETTMNLMKRINKQSKSKYFSSSSSS